MYRNALAVLVALFLVCPATLATAQRADKAAEKANKAKIKQALKAAPAKIAENAAVVDWDNTMLHEGMNGWTCFPDPPHTPGEDPMCLDGEWVKWAVAWAGKTTPDINKIGFAYMLEGGSDASNTDPYATEPAPGEDWVKSGPHIMIIVPDPTMLEGMTTDPYNGGPWVMWKGTPYAHVMMPVTKK